MKEANHCVFKNYTKNNNLRGGGVGWLDPITPHQNFFCSPLIMNSALIRSLSARVFRVKKAETSLVFKKVWCFVYGKMKVQSLFFTKLEEVNCDLKNRSNI